MLTTAFTELVGCSVPIQSAGMAELSSPALAAAVANAGAVGTVSVYGYPLEKIAAILDEALALTAGVKTGVICANFILRFVDPAIRREAVALAASKARLVEFFYSDPEPELVQIVHAGGALASWQVGSCAEALAAVDAGCDCITAQGIEAGGHVRGKVGLLALLTEILAQVQLPVMAAGGIGTGRAMAAVLAAGAGGVRVGTRFVASEEARAHPVYVHSLIAAEAADTLYSEVFWYGWPDAPHRTLRSCVEAVQSFSGEIVGERKGHDANPSIPIQRFETLAVVNTISGAIEAMPLWAGESVGGVKRVLPAAEIVRELNDEAETLLRRW